MGRTPSLALAVVVVMAACSSADRPATEATPTSAPTATPRPVPAFSALHLIAGEGSRATVRVHERLAANTFESDAILTTTAVSGEIAIEIDGSVWNRSKLVVDVSKLKSDIALRDRWVEKFGLETTKNPTVEFTPSAVRGLPASPLPVTGEWTFAIDGSMKVKDVAKPVSWQAKAKREGGKVEGTASTVVRWADFGIGKPTTIPEVVSVDDEIALEVRLASADSAFAGCDHREAAQFDFWVGRWDIVLGGAQGRATNMVTKVGCEIRELFDGPLGGRAGYVGRSVARWMPQLGKWQQHYIDNGGFNAYYTGGLEGSSFVLYRSDAGGKILNTGRLVWSNIGASSLEWRNEISSDGGKTWSSPAAGMTYTRAR